MSADDVIKLFFQEIQISPKLRNRKKFVLNLSKNVTTMLYFQAKLQSKTVYCFKIAYSCCFGLRGNLGELLEEKPSAFPKFCSLKTAFWFWRLWEVEIRNIQSTHSASLLQISKETLNPLTSSTQYLLHCCALERTKIL